MELLQLNYSFTGDIEIDLEEVLSEVSHDGVDAQCYRYVRASFLPEPGSAGEQALKRPGKHV